MGAKKSARQHARERGALDGADAQALEGALTMTERERDEALAKYQFMVDRAANEKLDGYRELASRLAAMEADRDAWKAAARPVGFAMTKLWVCTPCIDGQLCATTHESLLRFARATEVEFSHTLWNGDLSRVRSRAVHSFLESDATHLLFVDADVSFQPDAVIGMARAGVGLISTPYPKKRIKLREWRDAPTEEQAAAALYDWPFVRLPELEPVGDRAEVAYVPMGLTLIAREPLQQMVDKYRDTLTFSDAFGVDMKPRQSVALFMLMLRNGQLLPEDFSFCVRYTETTGERPWIYLGAGSPASHTGAWTFSPV